MSARPLPPYLKFPENFFWGASTSAHQVEGGTDNNWTQWEREHAALLARGSKKAFDTPSVHWYRVKDRALDPANYISGIGVDHFHHFEQDFKLAHKLNHNAHRLSIEWSRIQPRRGVVDERAIEHYRRVIKTLRSLQMEPLVTLFHFTLPDWVADQGGFSSSRTIQDFIEYVRIVATALGDDVQYWCTINEPEVFATFSYIFGLWPPQQRSHWLGARAYASILPRAHIGAYKAIKAINPQAQVSVSKNNMWYCATGKTIAPIMARAWWWWANHLFLDRIRKYQDFIGLNYYFKFNFYGFRGEIDQQNPSELGWGLHPEGIDILLRDLHKRYHKPIMITEVGIADSQDESRSWYIKEILRNIHKSIAAGVDVRGFLYWSLLDNFEWDKGFWPEFGLIHVDRKTQKRTVRQSAKDYAKIIINNGLD